MKINFILTGLYKSGGMKVIFKYGEELKNSGHDVFFYRRLLPYNFMRGESSILYVFRLYIRKIKNFIKRNKTPDDFYHHSFPIKSVPLINSLFVRKADVVIATEWVTAFSVLHLPINRGKKYYFIQCYENWRSNKALVDKSYILPLNRIVVSGYLKNFIKERFNSDSRVVLNGIDENEFRCSYYMTSKENITLTFVYSSLEFKNSPAALYVFDKIHQKYPGIKFISFSYDKVKLPPYINYYHSPDQKSIADIYDNTDIFLFTSFSEGFGLPPAEAMISGCAVVTTPVGAVCDYSVHLESAIHVDDYSPDSMVKWVEYLINNRSEIERIGSNSSVYVKTILNWPLSVKKFEQILLN
jgi:glycosyltransferase involved in cell wall biosynthesis